MSTPAAEVRSFAVTIPAGTSQASPFTEEINFPAREVVAVSWKVPPGPSGLMGWRLTMSGGQPVIPTGGGWIVADDQSGTWPVTGMPDGGFWEVTGYNTGAFNHTVYIDFLLDLLGTGTAQPALISSSDLSSPAPSTVAAVTAPQPVTVTSVTTPQPVTVTAVTTPQPVTVTTVTTPPPVTVPPVTVPGLGGQQ